MKRSLPFVAMLFLPALAGASAAWPPQDTTSASPERASPAAKTPVTHHPLFTLKYVLVRALPAAAEEPHVQFARNGSVSAIHPLPLSAGGSVLLQGSVGDPNVEICSGWACETPH